MLSRWYLRNRRARGRMRPRMQLGVGIGRLVKRTDCHEHRIWWSLQPFGFAVGAAGEYRHGGEVECVGGEIVQYRMAPATGMLTLCMKLAGAVMEALSVPTRHSRRRLFLDQGLGAYRYRTAPTWYLTQLMFNIMHNFFGFSN